MVHIETVDLSARGVTIPSDRVGMVLAQPYLSLTDDEPYRQTNGGIEQQLGALRAVLAVARSARHGLDKTHFTIIPEYSIPGQAGIRIIEEALREDEWPNGTFVVGGTDGLSRAQYAEVASAAGTHVDPTRNGPDCVREGEWVNCAVTWVKDGEGNVERWIQPKLYPAKQEMTVQCQSMFRGRSVYLFEGLRDDLSPYRFCTLVCFDWIASISGRTPPECVLQDMQSKANGNLVPVSWLFVIQHNKLPSHDTFLLGVRDFFDQTKFRNVAREDCCLVLANTAGRMSPGLATEYGGSSLVLSPQSLFSSESGMPTFSKGGFRFRGSHLIDACKDIYFRERGACIHSFAQVNPRSLTPGPAGQRFAIERADVCPISGPTEPLAPAEPVPASVKWINDEIDDTQRLSAAAPYRTAPLIDQADEAHALNTSALRTSTARRVKGIVRLAAESSPPKNGPDDWSKTEGEAVKHLISTLNIFRVAFPNLRLDVESAHAALRIRDDEIDLVAIRGTSHEACISHLDDTQQLTRHQVILVSRDPDNTPWLKRFGSFLATATPSPGQDVDITDPTSGRLNLGYQNLLQQFIKSTTSVELAGGILAELYT